MTTITKQANFLLPEDVLNELKTTVPIRQQSKVVTEALRKELKRIKLAKALETSVGAWVPRYSTNSRIISSRSACSGCTFFSKCL